MLTEHVAQIRQYYLNDSKQLLPELDEMQIEEIERTIREAFEHGHLLEVDTWKDGYFTKRCGYVKKVNPHGRMILFKDELEVEFSIHLYRLVGAARV